MVPGRLTVTLLWHRQRREVKAAWPFSDGPPRGPGERGSHAAARGRRPWAPPGRGAVRPALLSLGVSTLGQVAWRKPGLRRALHTHGTAPFAALGACRQCGGTRAGSRGVPGPGGGVRSHARGSPGGLLNPRGATCLRRSDRVPFPCDGAPLPKKLWREGRESPPCDDEWLWLCARRFLPGDCSLGSSVGSSEAELRVCERGTPGRATGPRRRDKPRASASPGSVSETASSHAEQSCA